MTKLILLLTFVVLQVADVFTTRQVLAAGGWEANPVAAWAMTTFGPWWAVPKLALMLACVLVMTRWRTRYVAPAVALIAVVVLNNAIQ
ncbi:DUF5658 family protein [uncultured Rhodoblastus sp.]|uniref:DUF5658 family protein n=1 Tax=uncultured Rhodoblastus sp. TaxID=543037 RepID=UPI0025FEF1A3|nr:DUF5658 family protein [uncultured Rhodoblastus sp.]